MQATTENLATMTLAEIARVIRKDWAKVNFAAAPYLDSMAQLDTVRDEGYGFDGSGQQIAYFLSNASSYRGEVARAVKLELKRRMK